jgi:hypothetical protein
MRRIRSRVKDCRPVFRCVPNCGSITILNPGPSPLAGNRSAEWLLEFADDKNSTSGGCVRRKRNRKRIADGVDRFGGAMSLFYTPNAEYPIQLALVGLMSMSNADPTSRS